MIKRTDINQQKTPTVMKNKNPYSNKGSVPLKTDAGTFDANTSPKPGMGKVKLEVWELLNLAASFLAFIRCR